MRPSWKLAVIGGEVTVLAAFTGLGIHLALQPQRTAFRPPALVLPSTLPTTIPGLNPALPPRLPSASPAATSGPPLLPDLFRRFGQQDRNLLTEQWNLLQRLSGAIERYVEARLDEHLARRTR